MNSTKSKQEPAFPYQVLQRRQLISHCYQKKVSPLDGLILDAERSRRKVALHCQNENLPLYNTKIQAIPMDALPIEWQREATIPTRRNACEGSFASRRFEIVAGCS